MSALFDFILIAVDKKAIWVKVKKEMPIGRTIFMRRSGERSCLQRNIGPTMKKFAYLKVPTAADSTPLKCTEILYVSFRHWCLMGSASQKR